MLSLINVEDLFLGSSWKRYEAKADALKETSGTIEAKETVITRVKDIFSDAKDAFQLVGALATGQVAFTIGTKAGGEAGEAIGELAVLVGEKIEDYQNYNDTQYAPGTNGARGDNLVYETINTAFGIGEENYYMYEGARNFVKDTATTLSPAQAAANWYADKFERIHASTTNPNLDGRVEPDQFYRNLGDFYNPTYDKGALMLNADKANYMNYVDRYGDVVVSSAAVPIATYAFLTGSTIATTGGFVIGGIGLLNSFLERKAIDGVTTAGGLIVDVSTGTSVGSLLSAIYNTIDIDQGLPSSYRARGTNE